MKNQRIRLIGMTLLTLGLGLAVAGCSESDEKNASLGDAPASSSNDIGSECQKDGDCSTEACIFAVDENGNLADFGYCSGTCEDFSDCPDFWECENVGNASSRYCIQD